jgi:hypothetical protein
MPQAQLDRQGDGFGSPPQKTWFVFQHRDELYQRLDAPIVAGLDRDLDAFAGRQSDALEFSM